MPDVDELIDESVEGKHARREGKPLDDCPHPWGTAVGNAWRRGWELEDRRLRRQGSRDSGAVGGT